MAVSKSLRHQVMRRDNHTCRYCGAQAPDVKLTIDHVTPQTLGGQDVPENLVAACVDCNAGKSATPPDAALVADVDQRAVEWGQAMQVAIERRTAELAAIRTTADPFDAAWSRWVVDGQPVPRDASWRNSILRFLAAGLNDQFFEDAIATAMGLDRVPASDKWRYFCGICWREMDTIQKIAQGVAGSSGRIVGAASTAQASAYRVDDFLVEHRVLIQQHPSFPALSLAETFIERLLARSSAPDTAAKVAVDIFWQGMHAAYATFLAGIANDGSSDGVTAAWEQAEEKLETVAAARWGEFESICAGTWDGRPSDSRMPQGPGLHPGFDALNLADGYLADVLSHLGVADERAIMANRGFWSAMEDAYKTFVEKPRDGPASEDCEVTEQFSMSSGWFLNQIWIASGRPKTAVPDGEE